jgi:hypothetical protein
LEVLSVIWSIGRYTDPGHRGDVRNANEASDMTTSRLEFEERLDAIVNRSRALWRALGASDLFLLDEDAKALKALAAEIEDEAAAARFICEEGLPLAQSNGWR